MSCCGCFMVVFIGFGIGVEVICWLGDIDVYIVMYVVVGGWIVFLCIIGGVFGWW